MPWQCEVFAVRSFAGCPVAKCCLAVLGPDFVRRFVQVLTTFENASVLKSWFLPCVVSIFRGFIFTILEQFLKISPALLSSAQW